MWRAILIGAAAVAAGIFVASALAQDRPRESGSETVRPADSSSSDEFEVSVTPEMRRHSRIRYILYFVGTAYGFAVLLFLLFSGLSRRMRDLAARATRVKFLVAMLYFALFSLATWVISFPVDYYSGFVVPHQFELSNQNFAEWLIESLKGLGIGILFGSIVVALALLGIRLMPRRWWLVLWAGAIPVAIFFVVIAPVFIDPVFNRFEPLEDATLRQKLLTLASRAGIEGADVFQVDKSRQTKTMNAYVTGLGPTKRIVMWDTLLAKMTHDETLAVMGHEMGHYVLNHIWKGMAFGFALMFGVVFLAQRVVNRGVVRWGSRWGFTTPDDPAALPFLLLVLSVMTFILAPVFAAGSRYMEHESDVFSLELTHLNEPAAKAFIKFSEDSKFEPQPPKFIEYWLYSHPPLAKRIKFALNYRPWESGQPNRAWKGN